MTIHFNSARETRELRTRSVSLASRLGSPPRIPQQAVSLFIAAFGVIWSALREHLRLDGASFVIVAIFAIALVPIIPHATSDAQLLTCCFDDEAPLTMALDGMRVWPYGNPSNFLQSTLDGQPELPGYWGKLRWNGFWYYGGTYLDLAFLLYWPLSLLGVPAFPAAPIILRTISFVMALAALLITYNFGRRHAGRVAGTIAALFLLTDPYFVMYAANIHPDTTELALGLIALAVSARLIDRGGLSSLVALAMLIGLAQATKFGGIWLLPMAAFATIVGLRRAQPSLALPALVGPFIARGALMGLVSFFVFVIATPYAFIKPDYFIVLRTIYSNIATSTMLPVSFSTWLTSLWGYHGPLTLVPALAGVALLGIQALRGHVRWPMVLAAILGATQLFWFSYMGRSWVVLGYMIGLFAVMGLFIGDLVAACYRGLARFARVPALALTAFIVLLAVGGRWWGLAGIALDYRNIEAKTLIRIGKWAEAGNIPRDARVLWDDSVYFDPAKFPNAKMNGHLITYNDVYAERPTYIILASHMYDAPHFAEMRKTQRYTMQNEGRNSLRLYQDLLAADQPGPTNVPGVEYVRSFSGEADRREDCPGRPDDGPYEHWLGENGPTIAAAIVTRLFGGGAVGAWIGSHVSAQLYLVNVAGWMIDGIRGRVCFTTGPMLRLYRLNPPGSLNGFSQPIASSSEIGFPALAAFDGEPSSQWKPAKGQAMDAFVGFDFGQGGDKEFGKVRVDWGKSPPSEVALEFQYADFGGEWQSAGRFRMKVLFSATSPFSEYHLGDGIGIHRLWRMQILQAPPEAEIAVREVRFLEDREQAPSANAPRIEAAIHVPRGTSSGAAFPKLTQHLFAGATGKLVFDEAACVRHDLGGLRCGSEYELRYHAQSNRWTVTGYSNIDRKVITLSSDNAEANPGIISVWGLICTYDDDGTLFYVGDKVGTIRPN